MLNKLLDYRNGRAATLVEFAPYSYASKERGLCVWISIV